MTSTVPLRTDIESELERILSSQTFSGQHRLRQFLTYIIEEALDDRTKTLKAYAIAVDVFGRDQDFDQSNDAIVRVQAGRLRAALADYYAHEGADSSIRISLPKGTYVPVFTFAGIYPLPEPPPANPASDQAPTEPRPAPAPSYAPLRQPPLGGRRARWPDQGLVLAALLLAFAIGIFILGRSNGPEMGMGRSRTPPVNTVALMPFTYSAQDKQVKPTASALEHEFMTSIGRTGAFKLKLGPSRRTRDLTSEEIRQTASRLGARWVVSGEIVRETDNRHIDVLLADGVSGHVIWSNSYLTPMEPTAASTRDTVQRMLFDFRPQLFAASKRAVEAVPPASSSAADLFLLATWTSGAAVNTLQWEKQRLYYARLAIAKDPQFGPSYSVLANKLAFIAESDPPSDTAANRLEAARAASQAIALAADNADTVLNVALYHWHSGNGNEAVRYLRRTLELDPHHVVAAILVSAMTYECTRVPQAVIDEMTAIDSRMSPANPVRWLSLHVLAHLHANNGNFDLAVDYGRRAHKIFSNPITAFVLALFLVETGHDTEAREIMLEQRNAWPNFNVQAFAERYLLNRCGTKPLRTEYDRLADQLVKVMTK